MGAVGLAGGAECPFVVCEETEVWMLKVLVLLVEAVGMTFMELMLNCGGVPLAPAMKRVDESRTVWGPAGSLVKKVREPTLGMLGFGVYSTVRVQDSPGAREKPELSLAGQVPVVGSTWKGAGPDSPEAMIWAAVGEMD